MIAIYNGRLKLVSWSAAGDRTISEQCIGKDRYLTGNEARVNDSAFFHIFCLMPAL